ncbi:MAG TPA: hypothetical protein VFE33_30095 [Thermoanaerobaculia bacterium]|nr:hypothetical protein [Thermoanaerobaculia bacterium]
MTYRYSLLTLLLGTFLASVPAVRAAEEPACPMHAQHQAALDQAAGVDARGDRTMGFDHTRTTHHFLLADDGGTIQVEANDAADTESRDAIRHHLASVAQAFAQGNFAMPHAVHDHVLPGIEEMTRKKADIEYRFAETERGGRVRITSADPAARTAIHSFLKAQIAEHRTGDPLVPPR